MAINNKQLQLELEAALTKLKQHPDEWNVTLMDASSEMFSMDGVYVSVDEEDEDIRFHADGTYCE